MASDDAIFHFNGLKKVLADMGYHIEEAAAYRPIANPIDVGIKELTESFKFTGDGIYYVDELGYERQVYLYKRLYHLQRFGKPRYHICKCQTIDEFILSGSLQNLYRATNAEEVPVINMDNEYAEETVDNLPMCKYCQRLMGEDRALASNEFVKLLKDPDGYQNKNTSLFDDDIDKKNSNKVDVDFSGYTRDWEEISLRIREEHNYTCEQCGIHIEEMSDRYYIHVHHVNGNKADNRPANLKCLCIRCHSRIDDTHKHNFSRGANRFSLDEFNKHYPEK